jgi:anthranilate/para-aminobenzoate synthase component II
MFELKNENLTFGIYSGKFNGGSYAIDTYGADLNYVRYFHKWGDIELITPLIPWEKYLDRIDVLVVPGGLDVDPRRYNEKPHSQTSNPNLDFEYLDEKLLHEWMVVQKRPVVAICRGVQTVNVSLGGSLYQHIRGHVQKKSGETTEYEMYTDIPGNEIVRTNSFHHQCIKELAPGLEMIGWSNLTKGDANTFGEKRWKHYNHRYTLDKNSKNPKRTLDQFYVVPELVRGTQQPILACQYHPEKNDCAFFSKLVQDFLLENFNIEYVTGEKEKDTANK